jgi:hypothetical protein
MNFRVARAIVYLLGIGLVCGVGTGFSTPPPSGLAEGGQLAGPARSPAAVWSAVSRTTAAQVATLGLATVFEAGPILQDRNGDELVDFVAARIILPDLPAAQDVAAAVAVAARLGLETSGLTFPLAFKAAQVSGDGATVPAIVIGTANPHLPAPVVERVGELEPGQGIVSFVGGTVAIVGSDADGTQVAGEAFASRSPYFWNIIGRAEGDTFEKAAADTAGVLQEAGIEVTSVSFDELLYEKDRGEVVRATVTVAVADGTAARARDALASLAQGHRRGRATDRLSYASVAEVVCRVRDGSETYVVSVPRVGVPGRYLNPPRRQPTRFEGQSQTAAGGRGGRGGRGGVGGGREPQGRTFDLAQIFMANDGLFEDEDGDRVSDATDMMIVFPQRTDEPGDFPSVGVTQLAARLGLESTGLRLPLFGFDKELEKPEEESRPLVLVGRQNRLVQELDSIGKLREAQPSAGTGRIEIVPDAYHSNSAVVVTGADVAGEEAAAEYLAHRAPYLWSIGRGEPTFDDAKESVRKALAGRTTASQAALAMKEIEDVLEDLEDKQLELISVDAYFEEEAPEFDAWVRDLIGRRFGAGGAGGEGGEDPAAAAADEAAPEIPEAPLIEVTSHRRMDPVEVFVQQPELEWEVVTFWKMFRETVLPEVGDGSEVSLEIRVSEAPELRRELEAQIRSEIEEKGGRTGEIVVLSAYKQGLSWLTDVVAPALAGRPVAGIEVGWKPFAIDMDSKERFQNEPARWLNELYPADDVLAGELGLPLEAFSFYMTDDEAAADDEATAEAAGGAEGEQVGDTEGGQAGDTEGEQEGSQEGDQEEAAEEHVAVSPYGEAPVYSVTARNASGDVLLEDSFSPAYYERPYFDAFPDYAQVTVTTGWMRAEVDGAIVVDERLATDSDRIWDHYQSVTLDEVYDHIKESTGGRPTRDKAPYFHTLRVELKASEPNYKLGIDEEMVSVLESLHDDIYFDTLDFFYQVAEVAAGGDTPGSRSLAAGNVLPWIHPEQRGQAPELKITYSAFASKDPKVVVKYREVGAEETSSETPARGGEQQTDEEEDDATTVTRLLEPVRLPDPYVYFAEASAGADELFRLGLLVTLEDTEPLPRLATLLDNLTRLQDDGLFEDAFALAGVANVTVRLEGPGAMRTRTYATRAPERDTTPPEPYTGDRLVTWDHVISPEESERISHTLGTLANVTTYVAGRSYQGRPVSVMEIKLPMEAELVSQAKLNTWKPVLSIVGRQHANEVSSTSHILRLAELLATDPQYQRYLHKMSVVIQPVVNPDGAALAFELQKLTPTHCLHAGRYSALGPDVPGQANNRDTLLTEALVMRSVSQRWVPDVSLNPHGYPSHEWVHQFANYNPKSFRSYWIPRGWYTSARSIDDPRLKDYADVVEAMLDYISEEVSRDPEVKEANLRIYDRYNRWTIRWQPHLYNLEIYNDTAIYHTRRSSNASVPSAASLLRPTVFSGSTEAMDETAQGPWLDLVTRMGFGYLMASVRFLDEADYTLYRLEGESGGSVRIALMRPRPIRAGRPPSEGRD